VRCCGEVPAFAPEGETQKLNNPPVDRRRLIGFAGQKPANDQVRQPAKIQSALPGAAIS